MVSSTAPQVTMAQRQKNRAINMAHFVRWVREQRGAGKAFGGMSLDAAFDAFLRDALTRK